MWMILNIDVLVENIFFKNCLVRKYECLKNMLIGNII